MEQKRIENYKLGLNIIRGCTMEDNRFLDEEKIEDAVFCSAYIAIFERFNDLIFSKVGEHFKKTYDSKKPEDFYGFLIQKYLKEKFKNKNTLKKQDIIDLMVTFHFMDENDKENYFKLKKLRDEIGHNLLEILGDDEKRFEKQKLIELLLLFKRVIINIHNEAWLIMYESYIADGKKDLNKTLTPFEAVILEFAVIDRLLALIIDREKYPQIFKVLEEE